MDNAMTNEVVQWLSGIREVVEAQAPGLAREIVRYEIVSALWGILVGGIFCMFTWICAKAFRLAVADETSDNEGVVILTAVLTCISGFIGVLVLTLSINALIAVVAAPRLVVATEIAKLVYGEH